MARTPGGAAAYVEGRMLDWRLDLSNHSPTGIEWGYGGSGPSQLALAILADYFEHLTTLPKKQAGQQALAFYQDFKWRAVAPVIGDTWELTSDQVREHLQAITEAKVWP